MDITSKPERMNYESARNSSYEHYNSSNNNSKDSTDFQIGFTHSMGCNADRLRVLSSPDQINALTFDDTRPSGTCTSCMAQLPSIAYCSQCDEIGGFGMLCTNCLSAHRFMHTLRPHNVTIIEDSHLENGIEDSQISDTTGFEDNHGITNGQMTDDTNCNVDSMMSTLIEYLSSLLELFNADDISILKDNTPLNRFNIRTALLRSVLIAKTLNQPRSTRENDKRSSNHNNLDFDTRNAYQNDVHNCSTSSVDQLLSIINRKYAATKRPPNITISLSGQIFLDNHKTPFTVLGVPKKNGLHRNCQMVDCDSSRCSPSDQQIALAQLFNDEITELRSSFSSVCIGNRDHSVNDNTFACHKTCKNGVLQLRHKVGSLGDVQNRLKRPGGVAFAANGDIIVADTFNQRVNFFGLNGDMRSQIILFGEDQKLLFPDRVAYLSRTESIVVADKPNARCRLQIFKKDGQFVRQIAARHITSLAGLTVSAKDEIGVIDAVSSTVFLLAENGNLIKWFQCGNIVIAPSDIAIWQREFFICDWKRHCVAVITLDGCFVRTIGNERITSCPTGIDVDANGRIYVGCNSHKNEYHVAVMLPNGDSLFKLEYPFAMGGICAGLGVFINTATHPNDEVMIVTIDQTSDQIMLLGSSLAI